ncbi:putative chromatin remodeling & transcriptional activation HMG family [Arabidopsis thaliana]
MKGAKSKAETRSTKLSVTKKPAKGAKGAAKDPNKPKRPSSAFFVFMEDFRVTYKEEHPKNKSVAAVGKAGGEKWKSLSDSEKAPYVAKADKRKVEYEKNMKAYNKKLALRKMRNLTSQFQRLTMRMMLRMAVKRRKTMIKKLKLW